MLGLQLDEDGLVVDSWLSTDFLAMLAQLGWGVAPVCDTVRDSLS